jgi:hypothetical protein
MRWTTKLDGAKVLTCQTDKYKTVILPLSDIYSLNDNLQDKAFEKALHTSLKFKGMLNPILVCTDEVFKTTDINFFERRPVQEEITQGYRCLIGNNRYKYAMEYGYTHIESLLVSSFKEVKQLSQTMHIEPRRF